MMKRTFKIFMLSLLLASASTIAPTWAQTEATQHQQNISSGDHQVHAKGVEADSTKSFIDRYAPPKAISSFGPRIDWLFKYTSWVTFGFFMIMALALGYFSWAYRARPGHKAYYTHGLTKNNKTVTNAFDLAVFLSLDVVLIIASFRDTRDVVWNYPSGPDVVKVMIMPQQWAWNIKYAGNDGIFGTADDINTLNDLRIPKGKPVMIQMKSKDVIHGFMVPNVRIQIDAIPGVVTKFWFDANETGEYEIACYHLCGTAHYKMKAFLKVLEESDYASWINESSNWAQAQFDPSDTKSNWGWNWGPDVTLAKDTTK